MRTNKAVVGYKALTQDFTGIHGTDFSVGSVSELPDCRPQAGKHGYTFATSLSRLFQCFNTNELPVIVEVVGYGETHIGRHLCATNHLFVTRVIGFHEIQETLNQERQARHAVRSAEPEEIPEPVETPDELEVEPEETAEETENQTSDIPVSEPEEITVCKEPIVPQTGKSPNMGTDC